MLFFTNYAMQMRNAKAVREKKSNIKRFLKC